jgi:hypothetical protein
MAAHPDERRHGLRRCRRRRGGNLIVGVDDLDQAAAELYEREIVLEPYTVPSGQFRLAELADPSGNTVTFAQTLTEAAG